MDETSKAEPMPQEAKAHESWRPDKDTDPRDIVQEEGEPLIGDIVDAIRTVFDPEIPVNIYDLGLIYEVDVQDSRHVDVKMTLTAPGCPVAQTFPKTVEDAVCTVEGVASATVELVWDPPWTQERMSEAARYQLNMF